MNKFDPQGQRSLFSKILNRYLARYKTSFREHSTIPEFLNKLGSWFESWSTSIHSFDDGWKPETEQMRGHTISILRKALARLPAIVLRETAVIHRWQPPPPPPPNFPPPPPSLQLI